MKIFLLFLCIILSLNLFSQDTSKSDCAQLNWDGREEIPTLTVEAKRPPLIDKHSKHNIPDEIESNSSMAIIDTTRYPGETSEFMHYLSEHVEYPKKAIEKYTQGKTFFTFEVDSLGYTRNVQFKRYMTKVINEEIHSVIMKTPKMVYKEGYHRDNGLPPGCYRMCIEFKLK